MRKKLNRLCILKRFSETADVSCQVKVWDVLGDEPPGRSVMGCLTVWQSGKGLC